MKWPFFFFTQEYVLPIKVCLKQFLWLNEKYICDLQVINFIESIVAWSFYFKVVEIENKWLFLSFLLLRKFDKICKINRYLHLKKSHKSHFCVFFTNISFSFSFFKIIYLTINSQPSHSHTQARLQALVKPLMETQQHARSRST